MRVAVYYTPAADDPLTRAAAHWLGRDAFTGVERITRADGLDAEEVWALTAEPRRYGFHATLKAPFHLGHERTLEALDAELAAFAAARSSIVVPALALGRLGDFFALVPAAPDLHLDRLAQDVVERFDGFRAPLDARETARRRAAGLAPRQDENLRRWGYPYVAEDFRFHMTLTGRVPQDRQDRIEDALRARFAPFLGRPLVVDRLALFVEPAAGAPFAVRSLHPLGPEAA